MQTRLDERGRYVEALRPREHVRNVATRSALDLERHIPDDAPAFFRLEHREALGPAEAPRQEGRGAFADEIEGLGSFREQVPELRTERAGLHHVAPSFRRAPVADLWEAPSRVQGAQAEHLEQDGEGGCLSTHVPPRNVSRRIA